MERKYGDPAGSSSSLQASAKASQWLFLSRPKGRELLV
jgi:hypothetical protein